MLNLRAKDGRMGTVTSTESLYSLEIVFRIKCIPNAIWHIERYTTKRAKCARHIFSLMWIETSNCFCRRIFMECLDPPRLQGCRWIFVNPCTLLVTLQGLWTLLRPYIAERWYIIMISPRYTSHPYLLYTWSRLILNLHNEGFHNLTFVFQPISHFQLPSLISRTISWQPKGAVVVFNRK